MATPVLDKLSKDLSFKIFDPVSNGNDDGRVFSKALRLSYINRAYGKLIRTLEVIHPKITKVFKDYYQIVEAGDLTDYQEGGVGNSGDGNVYTLDKPYDVYDVYYCPSDEAGLDMKRADYVDPDNFLPTQLGLNDLYSASVENRKWSIIDSKVVLLPAQGSSKYFNVKLFCRNYFPEFVHAGDETPANPAVEIAIPNDYKDILITMAAIEAMSDRGMSGKYQLYTATLNGQLQLIAQGKVNADIEEKGQK